MGDGKEALKELPQFAKIGGVGVVKVEGDEIIFQNPPVEASPPILRYLSGFLEGLCIEVFDMSAEGITLRIKVKVSERC